MYAHGDNQRVNHSKRTREDRTRIAFRENVNKHYSSNTISHSNFKSRGTSGTGLRILSVIEIYLSTGRILTVTTEVKTSINIKYKQKIVSRVFTL